MGVHFVLCGPDDVVPNVFMKRSCHCCLNLACTAYTDKSDCWCRRSVLKSENLTRPLLSKYTMRLARLHEPLEMPLTPTPADKPLPHEAAAVCECRHRQGPKSKTTGRALQISIHPVELLQQPCTSARLGSLATSRLSANKGAALDLHPLPEAKSSHTG